MPIHNSRGNTEQRLLVPWVLSAASSSALAGEAARLRTVLQQSPEVDPADVAYSLLATTTGEHRAVAVGAGRAEALAALAAIEAAESGPNVVTGRASAPSPTVLVFPGHGAGWAGRAGGLLDTAPAFAAQMQLCDAVFAEFVDWSLLEVVRASPGAPSMERVDVAEPVLFAVMVSLAAQWRELGIRPDAVLGYSQGEIAAACVAGALTLRDAATVVALRSKAVRALAGIGGMVSIGQSIDRVFALIEPWSDVVSVAAADGPFATTVTGANQALQELMLRCEQDGVPVTRIPVGYAAHSAQVEALRETLRDSLAALVPRAAEITFISSVTGAGLDTAVLDGDYWFANLRQPVLFEEAVRWAYEHGYRTYLESSPHPVLTGVIEQSLDEADEYGASEGEARETSAARGAGHIVLGTLRRDDGGWRRFLLSAAQAYVHGCRLDWTSVFAGTGHGLGWVELPPSGHSGAGAPAGYVTVLRVPETTGGAAAIRRMVTTVQQWVQDWLATTGRDGGSGGRLVVLTYGAVAVDASEAPSNEFLHQSLPLRIALVKSMAPGALSSGGFRLREPT